MAVQDYWSINGKKYFVLWEGHGRQLAIPRTVDRTLTGKHILYTGQGVSDRISQCTILIMPGQSSDWGTMANLEAAYETATAITIVENDDTITYSGTIIAAIAEQPIDPSTIQGTIVAVTIQKLVVT